MNERAVDVYFAGFLRRLTEDKARGGDCVEA
jgi:hypothetical protein